jgi:hypothetical protein
MPATRTTAAELSASRDGVVTQAQLVSAGHHHTYAHDEARSGRWSRLARGIYLTRPGSPTPHQLAHAGLLWGGPQSLITGAVGLALRGIAAPIVERVTVLVPEGTNRPHSGMVRVVRCRHLPVSQLLCRGDQAPLAVAAAGRCAADAIREAASLPEARSIATSALRDRRVEWDLVVSSQRPGPGAGHLGRVVREIADGVRSPAEAEVHERLMRAARRGSLPPYLLNPDVYVDGVLLGSPDAWFPGLGLGDEVDSREWHEDEGQLDKTLLRHERFETYGLKLNHVTPKRFRSDPEAHLRRLQELVATRQSLAVQEPPGLVVLGRGPLLPARTPWPQVDARRWR